MLFALSRRLRVNPSSSSSLICTFSHLHSTLSQSISFDSDSDPTLKPLTKPQLKTLLFSHYTHGKFSNLLQNVVASPCVLFTAALNITPPTHSSQLTLDSVSTRFDLFQLAHQLAHNEFNPETCCHRLYPPQNQGKGKALILPNLKLKVVLEALRIVLDFIYDGGFQTFVYGGREGLGRHTAVRYLKNTVNNPNWWFTVAFDRVVFDSRHVGKLCCVLGERINDGGFIGLIERLFACEAVRVELGGFELGKGLPQECGLCGVLINIYLNRFDRKIQKIRLRMNDLNPKIDSVSDSVVYKHLKVYAVRYLDEILMVTSGPKMVGVELLNWVVKYLEVELELKVDRVRTVIHSATSEKIDFLGMEFQAVPPSVLRHPLSEKAKRARLKFRRQKEVRALEMKNARESNRKKLGMKIFSHVFKKLKTGNNKFKFDYQIEDEVNEIFRTWADEVVQEFFESVEERWSWHRLLTAGDFLLLKRIRDQLPKELVDSYDKFQEEVDKHLNPVKARKALEEEERKSQEEEERKYSERTVEDLTKLCMKVTAPIELVRKAVRLAGFTNDMGRPRPISSIVALEDADIVKWYAGVGRRWLEYFSCCRNFKMVKTIVTYHLRFSCLLTLAEKHDATKNETIRHYSKDLKILDLEGNEEVYFPTERMVKRMGDGNFSDPKPVDGAITLALIRLAYDLPSYTCTAHFCDRKDTITYRVRLLENQVNFDPKVQKNWVYGMAKIHDGLDRKCFALCADHASDLYLCILTLQDIDCTSFVNVD